MEQAETHGGVGAGAQLQMVFGFHAQPGDARVDGDELGAALHEVDDGVPEESVGIREQRVLAPQDDVLGHLVARVVVTIGEERRVVELGIARAQKEVCDGAARAVAGLAAQRGGLVGGAQAGVGHGGGVQGGLATRALQDDLRFRPPVLLHIVDLLLDDVESLVPGDGIPFVLAAIFRVAVEGSEDAVGMIDVFGQGQAAHAQAALRDGMGLVAFDLDEFAVFDVEFDAATYRVASRRRPCAGADDFLVPLDFPPSVLFSHSSSFLSLVCQHVGISSLRGPSRSALRGFRGAGSLGGCRRGGSRRRCHLGGSGCYVLHLERTLASAKRSFFWQDARSGVDLLSAIGAYRLR